MNWFRRLESWCIPDGLKQDQIIHRNARFLVSLSLLVILSLVVFSVCYALIQYFVGVYVNVVLIIFISSFLVILRITQNLTLIANLFAGTVILSTTILIGTSGGINSSAAVFYIQAVMAVLWILRKEWIYVWCGVVIFTVLIFIFYEANGYPFEIRYHKPNIFVFASVNYLGVFAQLFIILVNYRVSQDTALGNVNEMNSSLVDKQEALRMANEELREQHLNVQSAYSALKYTSDKINEQKEEILIKSRELQAANHKISQINASLNKIVEKRTQQLRRTNEELDQFLYRSSHDLRRPLTTILGLKHVAELTFTDRAILELFEKVTDTAHNMDKMLSKLITVSDINKTSLIAARIDFGEVAERLRHRFQRQLEAYNVEVQLKLAPKVDFRAPERLVEIVIEQLVENALNFVNIGLEDQPFVRVEISTQNSRGIIRVVDNGIGIDPTLKNRIFEMYFKGTERSQGNGLGLYVAQKAAQKMMGTIEYVDGTPGTTVFELVVPMAVVV
ncbi:MAG: HAMP domain-containing sensor histidine kinase [Bacteroidota bacterium]